LDYNFCIAKIKGMVAIRSKKVAALHDISGVGKCSLTCIIPILSKMKHTVCPAPTAVLSTITGFFENYEFIDLTKHLPGYFKHWKEEGLSFDCAYSGFLGSHEQIDIVIDFLNCFEIPLKVIDPVFGDDKEIYPCFDKTIVDKMKELIKHADIITPNTTEAAFLLDEKQRDIVELSLIKEMLVRLSEKGPKIAVITCVPVKAGVLSTACFDKENNKFYVVQNDILPVEYPGTGDVFSSVFLGSILRGDKITDALNYAVNYIYNLIKHAISKNYPPREGLPIEEMIDEIGKNIIFTAAEF